MVGRKIWGGLLYRTDIMMLEIFLFFFVVPVVTIEMKLI